MQNSPSNTNSLPFVFPPHHPLSGQPIVFSPPSAPVSQWSSHPASASFAWTPVVPQYQQPTPLTPRKRRPPPDENSLPTYFPESPTPPSPPKKQRASPRTWDHKLHEVLDKLDALGWSLGHFLYYLFRLRDEHNAPVSRSHRHAATVQHFLRGKSKTTPAFIIDAWLRSSYGRVKPGSKESKLMYSTTVDYKQIKPIRPALTSFAVQLTRTRLCAESREALRVTGTAEVQPHLQWGDIGSSTVATATTMIQQNQPILLDLIMSYALQKSLRTSEDIPERKRRPLAQVCTHLVSTLNHMAAPRSPVSRLIPTLRGLYYFAESVPYNVFAFNSRIAHTPAYSTIYHLLAKLSENEAKITKDAGRDPSKSGVLRLDNVQNYLLQRDMRIGRENKLNIGIAATYFEGHDVNPRAFDLLDKRRRVAENKRQELTTEQLTRWIDPDHLELVLALQWLSTLTKYIPQLNHFKDRVSHLYRTSAAKIRLPSRRTDLHPLATSSKNETVTTELKDALVDFFGQIGQSNTRHDGQLLLVGGDGLTFEKLIQLKRYLQFHDDAFESGELIEPLLEWWHLQWTDLSRIFETHWGDLLTRDPSTLGHSATKIGRAKPPNLKKVDYYPSAELAYLVLDIRMLDCWRIHLQVDDLFKHFEHLASTSTLPAFDELEKASRCLYRAYSSTYAAQTAFMDAEMTTRWSSLVREGSLWTEGSTTTTASREQKRSKGDNQGPASDSSSTSSFRGDQSLGQSITFIRDVSISREMAFAVADGDAGRVYEMVKHMMFTFAGSSHHKYTTYTLETICNLELECSPELRREILKQSLVNLTGKPGSFCPGDFIQEYFNRLLQAIVERKGTDYGDFYVRHVIARNLHHLARIKLDVLEGEGLAKRSGRHKAPHTRAEVRILLEEYRRQELHLRRPGRRYREDNLHTDDLTKGFNQLQSGKLARWITDTTFYRNVQAGKDTPSSGIEDLLQEDDIEEFGESEATQSEKDINPLALMTTVDGEMDLVAIDPALDATKLKGLMGNILDGSDESPDSDSDGGDEAVDLGAVDILSDGE